VKRLLLASVLVLFSLVLLLAAPHAATPVALVSSTPLMTNVNRIGVNLGNQGQYGESDFMQNMLDDPGFELGQECWVFTVGTTHNSSAFTTVNDNGEARDFWNGAAASVRAGVSAGDSFTISGFNAGGTFACVKCPNLAEGDEVAICQTASAVGFDSGDLGGWRINGGGLSVSTAQKYEGQSSLAADVSEGVPRATSFTFDTATYTGGVCANDNITNCTVANQTTDCGSGNTCLTAPYSGPWHPVVGPFEIALYALGVNTSKGTPEVTVSLARSGGVNVSHTFRLANDGNWHKYAYAFTGKDTPVSAHNQMIFTVSAANVSPEAGATIYIDDAYLGRAEASATGFRDEVVQTLRNLNPGSLRYMIPYTLDQNDAYFEGPRGCSPGATVAGGCDFLKGAATTNTAGGVGATWYYASKDIYPLANAVGALPWFSIPNTFSDSDLQQFIRNACAAFTTYNFSSIWIEQSNEDWNGAGPGAKFGGTADGQFGKLVGRNFNVMATQATSSCARYASRFHYVIGNQTCNNGVLSKALEGAIAAGYPIPNTSQYGSDDATYNNGDTSAVGAVPKYSGNLKSQAAQYAGYYSTNPPGYLFGGSANCVAVDKALLGSKNTMTSYESGEGGLSGPGSVEQSYLSQAGYPSAMWMAEDWLLGTQALMPIIEVFTFSQTEFGFGVFGPLWGVTHDLDSDFGPTFPHIRPEGLGMAVLNSAMAGSYYPVNTSAISNVYANAFQNNGYWKAALTNANDYNVQLALQFPSTATLPSSAQTVHYTNGITDNNEDSNSVTIGPLPGGISISGNTVTLTLPPLSVVALLPPATPTAARVPSTKATPTVIPQ
jgi:hypothetical protein